MMFHCLTWQISFIVWRPRRKSGIGATATIKYGVDLYQMLENNVFGLHFSKTSSANLNVSTKLCDLKDKMSLQQIYYGAPGTGKSYEINERTKGCSVIRTTFHPDSDYSTFVGAYKPTMGKGKVYGAQGPVRDEQNNVIEEERITSGKCSLSRQTR